MRVSILLIIVLFWSFSLRGQVVWPGDVNNNGVVNSVDVLYLGLAHGSTGPVRAGGSEEWSAQNITALWGQTFPGGPDYAYADCNGDGVVDENDLDDVIKDNFGLTHGAPTGDGFANGEGGVNPPLFLEPEAPVVRGGAAVNIGLRLGTMDFPVDNFYGVALQMSYSAGVVDKNALEEGFDFNLLEGSWTEAGDRNTVEYLFRKDHATGKAELAIARLDQRRIPMGEGVVGQFSVVIADIIVGSETDTFFIQIDSILFIDDQLNRYAIAPDSTRIIISNGAASATANDYLTPPLQVRIYPNPAVDYLVVESDRQIDRLSILDARGRSMPLPALADRRDRQVIHTAGWPSGLYFIELYVAGQTITRKLAIAREGP